MDPIRLRGPADVLAALPYQLGYHPRDCLVAVALHDRRVGLVARIDLPDGPDPEGSEAAAAALAAPLLHERPDSVLLVGYETASGQCTPLLAEVDSRLGAGGLTVADRLVVRQGRWYSVGCHDQECCPDGGTPLPDPSRTPAVADFVALGMAPLPQREALTRLLAPDEHVCRSVATALRHRESHPTDERVAVRRLQWLSLWRAVCDVSRDAVAVETLEPADVAELVASLEDIAVRDGLIAWLCPGALPLDLLPDDLVDQLHSCLPQRPWQEPLDRGPGMPPQGVSSKGAGSKGAGPGGLALGVQAVQAGGAGEEVEPVIAGRRLLVRLQSLSRSVPDPHAAAVLTVTANVAWWLGDGTIARVALDRALEHAPRYRLARLLDHMVGLGVRHRPAR